MHGESCRKMSAAASVCAVAFEPSCGMLWLYLVTALCYAALQWRSVMMFATGLMPLVFASVQSTPASVQVAFSYACFYVSLDQ